MKGVSGVIVAILLLLIAIAIVGFASGFFQRLFGTASVSAEQELGQVTGQLTQRVEIDNVQGTTLTLRNRGSSTVATAQVLVYINNAPTNCDWANNTDLTANEVASCTLTSACSSSGIVRVTSPGSDDSRTCP